MMIVNRRNPLTLVEFGEMAVNWLPVEFFWKEIGRRVEDMWCHWICHR